MLFVYLQELTVKGGALVTDRSQWHRQWYAVQKRDSRMDGCWCQWPKADEISIDYMIYMVSWQSLEGPFHPIKRRALQGPLIRQKVAPLVVYPESA